MDTDKSFRFEKKTRMVVLLTAVTMAVEIFFGMRTNSMALLADGIHMASHVMALGLSWIAYILVRKVATQGKFKGDSNKILSLSGYSSGLMLLIFAFVILVEAVQRIIDPSEIRFKEAILVAITGLIVNIVSAFILHHEHEHSDHNIRAAYLHVLADALTSITAIIGLTAALIWDIIWLDALVGILGSFVIIKWSISLMKDSGSALLDMGSGKE
ncbi:MAG: zinc transporter ZitB [Bacteroidetes bacterium GWE2_41_25]|nr:MAG: zinc transporter ZitB [Bacteroidetes bacterium GWA2_40_15]OFX88927.1 MAG: zinc transporter ZitB [Bacteroidetes bacterium GWC2_40_22]OFX96061.1 MAG: zinc transporter ZitB [Bacteroidetes bacterium GWE2_41_25]OFY58376.1 MAG: zinc transporter ZitB [Bacteroidetes bacterium GWF2_41_9]HAM09847.1 cation transporter [Bacteroidales bacterium]